MRHGPSTSLLYQRMNEKEFLDPAERPRARLALDSLVALLTRVASVMSVHRVGLPFPLFQRCNEV